MLFFNQSLDLSEIACHPNLFLRVFGVRFNVSTNVKKELSKTYLYFKTKCGFANARYIGRIVIDRKLLSYAFHALTIPVLLPVAYSISVHSQI